MNNGISAKETKSDGPAASKSDAPPNPVATSSRRTPKTLGVTAIRPIQRSGWDKVRHFIYDKETGTYLARTPKSWALITLFYIVFFFLVVAFWFFMLWVIFTNGCLYLELKTVGNDHSILSKYARILPFIFYRQPAYICVLEHIKIGGYA